MPSQVDTEFVVTSGIFKGETYLLKVRAANVHGFGEFSDVVYVKAAGIPD